MTLTSITKGPKNRRMGKEKEIEEEKGNEGCIELEQWENQCPLQPEAQMSQSLFWSVPPELRQTHHEQAKSSRKNCNHTKLIELLMSM